MTIFVDRPRWTWRDERWSHLISDHSLDELHHFAGPLGLRRLSFQGDHYDLPHRRLATAVELGATVVDSRELVHRLRTSGLRHRPSMGWRRVLHWHVDGGDRLTEALAAADGVPRGLSTEIVELTDELAGTEVIVLLRTQEWGIGVTTTQPPDPSRLPARPHRWVVEGDRGHHIDWFRPTSP